MSRQYRRTRERDLDNLEATAITTISVGDLLYLGGTPWPLVSGRYYGPELGGHVGHSNQTRQLLANRVWYIPIMIPKAQSFDRIAVNVTASAAGNALLGVYSAGSDGYPDARQAVSAELDVSTTGSKEDTGFSWTAAVGWYYLAIASDVTCTVSAMYWQNAPRFCGSPSVTDTNTYTMFREIRTYDSTLPASAASSSTVAHAYNVPRILLRAA